MPECTPTAVAAASKCWCMDEVAYRGSLLYLLNSISGLNLTPNQLAAESKCWCLDEQAFKAAELYLLCAIANK